MSMSINLLPWREARRRKRTRHFYIIMLLVGALGALVGGAIAHGYQQKLASQQARNAHIKSQIALFEHELAEAERHHQAIARLERQLVFFRRLLEARPQTLNLFNDLAASHVAGVTYQRLERRHGKLSATAVADSEHQVSEQLRRLAQRPGLERPVRTGVERGQHGQRHFSFEIAPLRADEQEAP
ncbi:type IV pilus assembly protein PilN [Vreelandella songnenensis]|uniref:Type IV pilus assembly protein PilN n=1 Tax=Vreelandella songnenensis TaxID=1176243 RepID=A0A2T0V4L6_9GAMM|nr:PilN domain-containing protein [Halomonas songnenensis]PRY65129.1 type IV pilus assembly protein PilN [Halomonas songnenensis]